MKLRHLLICLLLTALLLPSCRKKPPGTIAFIPDADPSTFAAIQFRSIQLETTRRGATFTAAAPSASAQSQQAALRDYVARHVEAVILSPAPGPGWPEALAHAKSARIPVVLINRPPAPADLPDDLYATLITTDYVEQGRRAAQWLADHSPPDQQLHILELQAQADSPPARGRTKGFAEELAKHPNLHLLATEPANANRALAQQITARHLATNDSTRVTAIFAHDEPAALGAADALPESATSRAIPILSIEATRPALQALLDKKLACVIDANPWIGPEALDAINAVDKGYPLPKHLTMKDAMFDPSNITKEILADRKY